MSWNLPDDYGMGWLKCAKHNVKYHMSDGACDYCIDEAMPRQPDLTHGYKYVWLDSDGQVQMSSKNTDNKLALVIPPGKWILMTKDGRIYGGVPYNQREKLEEGDILFEVPEVPDENN